MIIICANLPTMPALIRNTKSLWAKTSTSPPPPCDAERIKRSANQKSPWVKKRWRDLEKARVHHLSSFSKGKNNSGNSSTLHLDTISSKDRPYTDKREAPERISKELRSGSRGSSHYLTSALGEGNISTGSDTVNYGHSSGAASAVIPSASRDSIGRATFFWDESTSMTDEAASVDAIMPLPSSNEDQCRRDN